MTTIVATTYLAMQTLVRTFLLNPLFGGFAEQVYPLLFALLVVFLFEPVNRRVQAGVENIFFRKRFDYKETISAVSQALTSVLNPDQIITQIVHTIRKEMFIDMAGVIVLEPQKKTWQSFFIGDRLDNEKEQLKNATIADTDPLLTLIAREKKLLTKYDIEESVRYRAVKEVCRQRFSELAASVAIPLVYQDEVRGVLALGYKKSGHFYTREDIDLLLTMANQAALALENAKLFTEYLEKGRLEEELRIAHNIQVSMLPEKAPTLPGLQIAARSLPARQVGGDFYDFIEVESNGTGPRLGIVVGDVSGKAMSAALLMAASRSIFRVLSEGSSSVEEIMMKGNQRLNRDIKKGTFVALLYAVVDPMLKTLTLSNAGQTQPILCPADLSKPEYIDTAGDKFPLGIVKNCQYQETRVTLQLGDIVVLYTDGIVEAMNGQKEMYGFERLMAAIEKGRNLAASSLLESLINDVANFVGNAEQHDDLTVVVLKVDD
jgi:serine phosphatase RsbU (regulator of sigma subunit)